jgi:membrane protease subunit HflC
MTAYENGMRGSDTRFLLRPESDFFRFFGTPSGKPAAANGSVAATAAAPATPPAAAKQ